MKVLIINGSPHSDGVTHGALAAVEKELNDRGIETVWYWIGDQPVRGCIGCNACRKTHQCRFTDDNVNQLIDVIAASDGLLIGTPVYFAGANGSLCALLDRVFFAGSKYGRRFRGIPAATVATCWRAGTTAALDRINKYFTFSQMPVASSTYWNNVYDSGVENDRFGAGTMKHLGRNMADLVEACASIRK